VAIASPLPPRYDFLDPEKKNIERFWAPGTEFLNCDSIVVLDTGTFSQLGEFGEFIRKALVPIAVVDHHRTQDDLGGLAFVDISSESTGRLTHEIITALGVPVSARAADFLFAAVATDTGWFRHPNASAATFALAEELVKCGANPTRLYEQLYEAAPLARFKLHGVALSRLTVVAGGQIAYTEIYLRDYAATGAVPGDTEELINYPRSIEGVEVALVFIEQPEGGTKVSFRARSRVDVSKLAEKYGGGGHRLASGARLPGTLEYARDTVLKDAAALL
jgi:phosphoesterase RecJ-like protein